MKFVLLSNGVYINPNHVKSCYSKEVREGHCIAVFLFAGGESEEVQFKSLFKASDEIQEFYGDVIT